LSVAGVVQDNAVIKLAYNDLRLDAGGGIAKARTRVNDDVTHPLSAETTPRLRQTARCGQSYPCTSVMLFRDMIM